MSRDTSSELVELLNCTPLDLLQKEKELRNVLCAFQTIGSAPDATSDLEGTIEFIRQVESILDSRFKRLLPLFQALYAFLLEQEVHLGFIEAGLDEYRGVESEV